MHKIGVALAGGSESTRSNVSLALLRQEESALAIETVTAY